MRYLSLALPLVLVQACSGKLAETTSGDGGAPDAKPPPVEAGPPPIPVPVGTPGTPPAPPVSGPPLPPSTGRVFAFQRAYLGDTTRDGVASTNAWKKFGYNLDGKVTTKDSTDVCTLQLGASRTYQLDGDNGIDNGFGSSIVPMFQTFATAVSSSESASFQKGDYTHLLQIVGLKDDPAQSNVQVGGQDFIGGSFGGVPTFTLADNWPVLASSLQDPSRPDTAKTRFSSAYVASGTWVGYADAASFALLFNGIPIDLTIHHAVVTFDHTSPNKAANGTIAGVIDTEEFIAVLRAVAGRISDSLCNGSAFDSIATQIRQASDILKDGTNAPGVPCDGISIGLGFEGAEIGPLTRVAGDPPLPPNPCP
jgi:hypothetical protein